MGPTHSFLRTCSYFFLNQNKRMTTQKGKRKRNRKWGKQRQRNKAGMENELKEWDKRVEWMKDAWGGNKTTQPWYSAPRQSIAQFADFWAKLWAPALIPLQIKHCWSLPFAKGSTSETVRLFGWCRPPWLPGVAMPSRLCSLHVNAWNLFPALGVLWGRGADG